MNAIAQAFEQLPPVGRGIYAPADFEAVREIAYQDAGIVLPPGKAILVYSRLAPLVRQRGCTTFAAYVTHIQRDAKERRRAICALTTNHTFFFREEHHFEHLAKHVRPKLVDRAVAGDPIRLWSAGCASGEETWSIVMTLLGPDRGAGKALAAKDVRVLATDIADHALQAAEAASYAADSMEAVPPALRTAWTTDHDDRVIMSDDARAIVRFRSLNLLKDWPMRGQFDIIFCRNVMIYFDQPTKERLVKRFADQLAPGGFLYIGHSERVTGPAATTLQAVGPTIYQRGGQA